VVLPVCTSQQGGKFAFLRCGRLLCDMNGKRGLKIKWKYFAAVSFDK